jgi:type VI secretion system secreted protein VgrG
MKVSVMHDDNHEVGNDQEITITGNRTENVQQGNDAITVGQGNRTIDISKGSHTTTAMKSITLKVGQSSVKIDQTGVTIKGLKIQIQGNTLVTVQGGLVKIN